jgi:hypothetical protein
MELQRFRANCEKPSLSVDDLMRMRSNAQAKGALEFVNIAEEVLDRRFPGWDQARTRGTPTRVAFRGEGHLFQTAKEAYVWLIEEFVNAYPGPFQQIDWSTAFVAEGRKRLYFGRSPKELFYESPHLAEDKNHYHRLKNGWYVNLNLGNDQKLQVLCRFAAVAKIEFDKDWSWDVV